jgi:hypothetical protein
MGTYLAHHWLVSEIVVVDKKNTSVGWVFDFFVIPICSDIVKVVLVHSYGPQNNDKIKEPANEVAVLSRKPSARQGC